MIFVNLTTLKTSLNFILPVFSKLNFRMDLFLEYLEFLLDSSLLLLDLRSILCDFLLKLFDLNKFVLIFIAKVFQEFLKSVDLIFYGLLFWYQIKFLLSFGVDILIEGITIWKNLIINWSFFFLFFFKFLKLLFWRLL